MAESSPVRKRGVSDEAKKEAHEMGDRHCAFVKISVAIFDSSEILFRINPALAHGATFCRHFQWLSSDYYDFLEFYRLINSKLKFGL